ncbi:MAG: metallophosphoesterase family protein [Candidatus Altiarchaeota archaeon]|nr:metallophosphoesterase family protein [Candidatus Altiarchaeota archaeon]
MLVIHLSDLHCGNSGFNSEALELAIEEINELMPDIVVVTGDLTDNGFLHEYELARDYLSRIKCERKIIGTGNHDYRLTGYLLCKRFFQKPGVLEFRNTVMVYLSTARPDKNEGEVGYRQIQWLEKILDRHKEKFKVVALHHHLVPVPDTGLERNTVTDAGDVLRAITHCNVDLVLCGHRHRPWSLKLNDSMIINAGTVSSEKFCGFFANSYNIIEIEGDGINARIKLVGGKAMDFGEILDACEPFIP